MISVPMAPTQVARPFHHAGWVYEEKVDGWRVLAYKDVTGVRLVSRNGRDLTRRFAELAAAVAGLEPPTVLLDGEVAVFDRQLISRFEWLPGRPKDEAATPPILIAFDCLYARGKDLRERPLRARRAAWLRTASRRGPRCSSAATRGWSGRTRPRPTEKGGRSPGSR